MATDYLNPNDLIFIQSRAESNPALVDEYAAMMEDGVGFDPVQAFSDGSHVYVWDGYHRGEAAKRTGKALFVMMKPGSREEAEWMALSANQKHGLRRSNADKRRVVELALSHPRGAQMSDNSIAHHCGVSHTFVGKIRAELDLTCNRCKSDDETTGEFPQSTLRTGADGRTINTANIGNRPPSVLPRGEEGKIISLNPGTDSYWLLHQHSLAKDRAADPCYLCGNPAEWYHKEDYWLCNRHYWKYYNRHSGESSLRIFLANMEKLKAEYVPEPTETRYCRHCGAPREFDQRELKLWPQTRCEACGQAAFVNWWLKEAPSHGEAVTPSSPFIGGEPGNPYAVTECPNCGKRRIFILPNVNKAGCDGCGRAWETIGAYHAERNAKLEKERAVQQSFHVEIAPLGLDRAGQSGANSPNELGQPGSTIAPAARPKKDKYQTPIIGETSKPETDWKCHNCGTRQPAGTSCTAMEINGGTWQLCPVCLPDYRKRAGLPVSDNGPEFTCPRCGGRTGHVNGGAICLSQPCGASWATREAYESELEAYLEDLDVPPLTVDFSDVSTGDIRRDLAAVENGYGGSPMAEKMRAELALRPFDRLTAQGADGRGELVVKIAVIFERVIQAATPEQLEDILAILKRFEHVEVH